MKNRINTVLVLLLLITATACSKKEDYKLMTVIGLTEELYGIDQNNETRLTLLSTGPVTGEVSFVVSGELKEGEDYELVDKRFVFENSMDAQVKIKFLKEIPVEARLEVQILPVDFATLALSKAGIGMDLGEPILYTFEKSLYNMSETVDITVLLNKRQGTYSAETEMAFEVEVDTELSTAVEGVHFSFSDGNKVIIPARKNRGEFKMKLLKEELGKGTIVLRLKNLPSIFRPGNYDETTVVVNKTTFERLTGSWKFVAFANYDWLVLNTGYMGDDPALLPVNHSANDILTFDNEKLTVSMTGDMKNYFRNTNLIGKGEFVEYLQEEPGFISVNMLLAEGLANVAFSANKTVERQSGIGLRIWSANGKEYLDVTVRDFEPVDFLQNTYNMVKDWGAVPMEYYPLRFRFERVK